MSKSDSPGCRLQLKGSSIHKQAGWIPVHEDVYSPMQDNELVSPIQDHTMSQTHSRIYPCNWRFTVYINSETVKRVVTAPLNVQKDCSSLLRFTCLPHI